MALTLRLPRWCARTLALCLITLSVGSVQSLQHILPAPGRCHADCPMHVRQLRCHGPARSHCPQARNGIALRVPGCSCGAARQEGAPPQEAELPQAVAAVRWPGGDSDAVLPLVRFPADVDLDPPSEPPRA